MNRSRIDALLSSNARSHPRKTADYYRISHLYQCEKPPILDSVTNLENNCTTETPGAGILLPSSSVLSVPRGEIRCCHGELCAPHCTPSGQTISTVSRMRQRWSGQRFQLCTKTSLARRCR